MIADSTLVQNCLITAGGKPAIDLKYISLQRMANKIGSYCHRLTVTIYYYNSGMSICRGQLTNVKKYLKHAFSTKYEIHI